MTHIRFTTANGIVNGLILETTATGYIVSAFGGHRVAVPYGFVCYS